MIPLEEKVKRLQGPILVLGASGFVGATLLRMVLKHRPDAYGTYLHSPAWRLEDLAPTHLLQVDLLAEPNLERLLGQVRPKTIFNCVAYGAYSFEKDPALIYRTNFNLTESILRRLDPAGTAAYVHAGSSSEYGENASGPAEDAPTRPNSDYSVSKIACAHLLEHYGKKKGLPCANLRLYSVYGPLEDPDRLIPQVVQKGLAGGYPEFVDPEISRDFVYVDDTCEAFLDAALGLGPGVYGDSFNVGSGTKTTIRDVAKAAAEVFGITQPARFQTMANRSWDLREWFANTAKTRKVLGWEARTDFRSGLKATADWVQGLRDPDLYRRSSKRALLDQLHSLSVIVACRDDSATLPDLYGRLKKVLEGLGTPYEVLFVDDHSSDDTPGIILRLSREDPRVIGITHSRRFGPQAAFRSGLEVASMNGCVLLDGTLQDPPELIAEFLVKWKEGYDVVYGHRVKQPGPFYVEAAYKLFYRVLNAFSYLRIPVDVGDFCLMDRQVVRAMLQFNERDFFLRGVRAYVGFKQTGVDYERATVPRGKKSQGLLQSFRSAKTGILSFSYTPLTIVTFLGTGLFLMSGALVLFHLVLWFFRPEPAFGGPTDILLAILFFGSFILFTLGILGEYIAKIFEEVKGRPRFLRRDIIRNGEVRSFEGGQGSRS